MQLKKIWDFLLFLPRLPALGLIKIYQKTISPDHGLFRSLFPGGYCRFYPTCSEYGYQTIKKNGLIIGIFKSAWRILRCNPWSKGGVDLP
ncbi:MAG TPA: membrane protein insertion efficiency factor YidD [Candidatus Udaeobacter sp.]|nr:membrane protein insertion efficiency factor YidD [Candidatus Udaeobacter sp.]